MSATAPIRVFVPIDAAARSMGADRVAAAIAAAAREANVPIDLVRTSSRGMLWLEPLVEVETARGRVAYGPVRPSDVPSLIASHALRGDDHPLRIGAPERHPYLARQERLIFARAGITDPLRLDEYEGHGGWRGLRRALDTDGRAVVDEVKRSGLRGRGGAGFPTGIKWQTVLDTPADRKFIVCNADEGDSGTFSDRMALEGDPYLVLEGMAIAGVALGATMGYVYLRSEYPDAERTLTTAIERAREAGFLGDKVLGSRFSFDVEIRRGAGSYVCGEETALLESLEGKRGIVRYRPPVPAVAGLWGKPTALNNVMTFASVPWIVAEGGAAYAERGSGRSRGTLPFQLAGNVKQGGLVETALGLSVRSLVEDFGGGTLSGRPLKAVQIGGPLGSYLPAHDLDVALDYEALAAKDAILGHGGVVAFDDTADMGALARYAMAFCAHESCGKCTPCRIGAVRGVETIDRLLEGRRSAFQLELLESLCDTMTHASLCAMGGLTPLPVRSAIRHFPADFGLVAETAAPADPRRS